jgi:predicted nucleic acid-binding protein
MIVYVESNFVLEIAFLQEEHDSCDRLLGMAETQAVNLVPPALSIVEPYERLARRATQRLQLQQKLSEELRELSRSKPYKEQSSELQKLTALFVISIEEEEQRLNAALERVLHTAQIIPIGPSTIRAAIGFQTRRSLKPQDALIYASVIEHLETEPDVPHCFISRDKKAFTDPDIKTDLATFNCRLLTRFSDGLSYIRSQPPNTGSA